MTTTAPIATPIAWFETLCGATVVLLEGPKPYGRGPDYGWICQGCGDSQPVVLILQTTRADANKHAGTCRSRPKPQD